MDLQNILQSASSGASSSGFIQVETIVGSPSFRPLDLEHGNKRNTSNLVHLSVNSVHG
jgi:hypothetical protein